MARNVTEQELDALLARPAGNQPGVDAAQPDVDAARPAVETRDFHEPRWLAPEDLEAFQRPARGAGASVVEGLRAALPREVEFDGVEVAEDSLDSGLRDPLPESVAIVSDGPVGPSLAILEVRGALSLAELALGAGDASAITAHALSPLESEIVERLLAQAFACVAQAFNVPAKDPRFVSDPAELARVLGSEGDKRRVAVRVAIALGENKFVLHFLLAGVPPPPRKSSANARDKQAGKGALPAEIGSTRVEVSAILAELEIMLTDLLALEAGDMIPLTVAPGEPILLRIEGEPCGRARFGERDGRMAIRLTEILRPSPTR
jgi:flagellar motor switch protein FliM